MKTENKVNLIALTVIVIISISFLRVFDSKAQSFHQFGATNLMNNPAFAGSSIDGKVNIVNRISPNYSNFGPTNSKWWRNFENLTYVGYDQYYNTLKGGVGLYVKSGLEYTATTHKTDNFFSTYDAKNQVISLSAIYSRRFNIGDKAQLATGIESNFFYNHSNDYDEDSSEIRFRSSTSEKLGVNLSLGAVLNTAKFYIGITARNLFRISQKNDSTIYNGESKTNYSGFNFGLYQLNLQIGYSFKLTNKLSINPNIEIGGYDDTYENWSTLETQITTSAKYKGIEIGGGFNTNDIILGLAGFQIKNIRLAYSIGSGNLFDHAVDLSHELSIRYLIK